MTGSATRQSEFHPSQEKIGNACKNEAKLKANVHPIGGIEQISDRTNKEYLGSTRVDAQQTKCHRDQRGPADGEFPRRVPILHVVLPPAENEVYVNENNTTVTKPVGNNQHKVAQRLVAVGDVRDSDQ